MKKLIATAAVVLFLGGCGGDGGGQADDALRRDTDMAAKAVAGRSDCESLAVLRSASEGPLERGHRATYHAAVIKGATERMTELGCKP